MNKKILSILIILGTLAIGFIGGFLTNGLLFKRELRNFRQEMQQADAFVDRFLHRVQANPEQAKEIRPIISSHFQQIRQINRSRMRAIRIEMDSLRHALTPYLTPEQINRMGPRKRGKKKRQGEFPPFDNPVKTPEK
ncbi:MAG: hypothetical protein AAFR61_17455 [Bacteroidota bacterium]